tara:strand:- start:916 stop:1161 length:246 start_codon:yes stop_codon:yes gene_type:complete
MKEIKKEDIEVCLNDIKDEKEKEIHTARYGQCIYEFISEIEELFDISHLLEKYQVSKFEGKLGARIAIDFPDNREYPKVTK